MMTPEMIECLVRVGPGTPMGNLMRRYWVPALLSREIPEPDCPPVRVKLLGERLLAFRDSEGRPGLVDEFCAHRRASLFLGRNEEGGIRCSYHGWKYDIHGNCVELPSAPQIACKVKLKAYPCIERGDIVWAYMGPPGKRPEPPELEWALVPPEQRYVSKRIQECGWLQSMEGGIDTTHASWVHRYELDTDPMHKHAPANKYIKADRNAVFDIVEAEHGLTIFGRRNGEDDSYYYRITQWIFPWFTLIPPFGPHALGGHMWIPRDDESCWTWNINFFPDKPLPPEELEAMKRGEGIHAKLIPGTFRPVANRNNDWLIDRQAQREGRLYSGVQGFGMQDSSLQESMGPIQDYEKEFLVPTDKAIVMTRRALYRAARDLEKGVEPPALSAKSQRVRAASILLNRKEKATEWAKAALQDSLSKPVYTV
ncbi:MAG TPA: aromatic ring-hydroxylating dioxygenase subunit alpha [Burkholderiales bacterium]|nr:aromatic ring-hydroxylating dioxygenase subunit alpha [Burkholderiales bacterium]